MSSVAKINLQHDLCCAREVLKLGHRCKHSSPHNIAMLRPSQHVHVVVENLPSSSCPVQHRPCCNRTLPTLRSPQHVPCCTRPHTTSSMLWSQYRQHCGLRNMSCVAVATSPKLHPSPHNFSCVAAPTYHWHSCYRVVL